MLCGGQCVVCGGQCVVYGEQCVVGSVRCVMGSVWCVVCGGRRAVPVQEVLRLRRRGRGHAGERAQHGAGARPSRRAGQGLDVTLLLCNIIISYTYILCRRLLRH